MLATTFHRLPNGERLRVARLGSGPPLLLLHGYPDNLQIWSRLAPLLAGRFEVIAIDWPGMGRSDALPGGATPYHMADHLLIVLDALGLERVTLAGMDMGGQPALAFAVRHPERLEKLIVMNSLVLWDEETSWEIRLLRRFGWNRFIIRKLPRLAFRRAERSSLPGGIELTPEVRGDLWESFSRSDVRTFIARMCAGYQGTLPGLARLYDRITAPALILWGECDRHFPPAHARRLHDLIDGSILSILPDAGHWMVWDRADEVAEQIGRFLELQL
jgi:pimeloyl-ACP methyl ester carboxylesterase